MRRRDGVALVAGLVLIAVALGALWFAFTGTLDWQLVGTVAPLALVAIGMLGLVVSRNSTDN
jgi:hypothetical protein